MQNFPVASNANYIVVSVDNQVFIGHVRYDNTNENLDQKNIIGVKID